MAYRTAHPSGMDPAWVVRWSLYWSFGSGSGGSSRPTVGQLWPRGSG